MKIYVDEIPNSKWECPFAESYWASHMEETVYQCKLNKCQLCDLDTDGCSCLKVLDKSDEAEVI